MESLRHALQCFNGPGEIARDYVTSFKSLGLTDLPFKWVGKCSDQRLLHAISGYPLAPACNMPSIKGALNIGGNLFDLFDVPNAVALMSAEVVKMKREVVAAKISKSSSWLHHWQDGEIGAQLRAETIQAVSAALDAQEAFVSGTGSLESVEAKNASLNEVFERLYDLGFDPARAFEEPQLWPFHAVIIFVLDMDLSTACSRYAQALHPETSGEKDARKLRAAHQEYSDRLAAAMLAAL